MLAGSRTGLNEPSGVTVDGAGNTYVTVMQNTETSAQQSSIEVFAAGSNGNVGPARTIVGTDTDLSETVSLAVDSAGSLYASNPGNGTVSVFAPTASGNVAPVRLLDIAGARGIALDPSDVLYVVENGPYLGSSAAVLIFAAGAGGDATPIRSIAGAATGLANPMADAVDAAGNVYVTNATANAITVYGPSASGNATPIRTIAGGNTTLAQPLGIAVDAAGDTYVANTQTSSIVEFAAGANGNVAPIRTIAGAATELAFPSQITIAP